ncbi:DNA-binding protein [Escherichia coli]|nr:DNA-binding protein [Escherichia coli]
MTRDEAINELWKLKRRGWADNKGPMWWLTNEKSDENDSVTQAPKVTAQMLIEFIGQEGAKTCEELAGKFGVSTRKVASTLAVVTATGRLARVNQNGKFRYCMPGDNLPAEPKAASVAETDGKAFPQPACVALPVQEAATQEDIKTETVADIVQPLEKRVDNLVLPSLRQANRELRRAKSDIRKWERVCAALRELNKHRDIIAQLCQEAVR